jgi:hypothetical protein
LAKLGGLGPELRIGKGGNLDLQRVDQLDNRQVLADLALVGIPEKLL